MKAVGSVGVFDSGFGGLTVYKEIIAVLPAYDYIYLGDNARAPYGDHSQEVIYRYAKQAVDFLLAQNCQLIVFACNTASAEALPKLQEEYKDRVKILGVIKPVIEMIHERGFRKIGVLGTRATVNSHKYRDEAHSLDPSLSVVQLAAPLLVPLIEEGVYAKPWAKRIVKDYVRRLKSFQPEAVVLACTHYGIIKKDFERYFGKSITVLDAGKIVAERLADYLERHSEIVGQLSRAGTRIYLTTDDTRRFDQAAVIFLGQRITSEHINFE